MRIFFIIFFVGLVTSQECEPINVDFCISVQGVQNYSVFKHNPNGKSQHEVANLLSSPGSAIDALRQLGCHEHLVPFICMYYLPVCPDGQVRAPVYPCRSVCQSVKDACTRQNHIAWPDELDCSKLPVDGANALCASGSQLGSATESQSNQPKCPHELDCPGVLRTGYGSSHYFLGIENCAPPCHEHFWSDEEVQLSRKWILTWSILCLVSTLFTVSTYLIDRERFRYPERPIVFLAGKLT